MNVLLINPDAPNNARISTAFELEIGEIGHFPPIGLITLAATLRQGGRHRVEVLDGVVHKPSLEDILQDIRRFQPGVVGISAFTYTFYDVLQLAKSVKAAFPELPVVVGGPHTSLFPAETLAHPEIDYLVIGEGEEPFAHLLERLEAGRDPDPIGGLAFRVGDGLHIGAPGMVGDLDSLPLPAYDLLDAEKYYSTFGHGGRTITLNSSRGCPFKCTFCQVLVKKYRAHSINYLIAYIRHFYGQGYRNFYFFDDLFNISPERVLEFSRRVMEECLDISWVFRGRVDQISEEVCREAARAGCAQILFGIEDYTDDGLKQIRKQITIDKARLAIRWAHKYGIKASTNWILGLPTHTEQRHLDELIRTAIDLDGDYAMFSILQLLPGCRMYEEAVDEGSYPGNAWRDFVFNPVPRFHIPFFEKYLSGRVLETYLALSHRRYYRRLGYILKRLAALRSFSEFVRHVRAGLKVLRA